ncbi:hypothetical protein V6N12_042636 [Hibiscus sabdariffa]|uniref:Uncharacterized protein n=1 Tax=Hibiscus sabdariffa TaxID=183260 RepID=A0ABR1ZBP9_9ROSI
MTKRGFCGSGRRTVETGATDITSCMPVNPVSYAHYPNTGLSPAVSLLLVKPSAGMEITVDAYQQFSGITGLIPPEQGRLTNGSPEHCMFDMYLVVLMYEMVDSHRD